MKRSGRSMKGQVIEDGVRLDRDVAVGMRDGAHLMVNVFRPADERPAPVLMSVTPYGRDALADWIGMTFRRLAGVRFGRLECSRWSSSLSVDVLGRAANWYPAFHHGRTSNRGTHTIHTGGRFDSHLTAPIVCADMKGHHERRAS